MEKSIQVIQYKGIFLLLGDRQPLVMEIGKKRKKVFEGKTLLFYPSCVPGWRWRNKYLWKQSSQEKPWENILGKILALLNEFCCRLVRDEVLPACPQLHYTGPAAGYRAPQDLTGRECWPRGLCKGLSLPCPKSVSTLRLKCWTQILAHLVRSASSPFHH